MRTCPTRSARNTSSSVTDPQGNIDPEFANAFGTTTGLLFQTQGFNQAPFNDRARDLILLPDGRAVVAGSTMDGANAEIGVMRLLAEQPPTISIGDATVTEGDSGTVNAVFTVTLSEAYRVPITVNVSTTGGTAVSGTDFTALPSRRR